MSKKPRLMPENPRMFRANVVRTEQLTPSMQRVTVTGEELAAFPWRGFDHWFRFFVPLKHQESLVLPAFEGSTWWQPYLAIPEEKRPHCANYTVADFRPHAAELDIEFVLHRGRDGRLEGRAALWACSARAGDPLALLDQGVLFDPPADTSEYLIAADESGLPSTVAIVRSLPGDAVGRVIQEVPTRADRRVLDAPPGVEITWIARDDPDATPGRAALEAVREVTPAPDAYAFVVGESTLATEGRRHLVRSGLPKDRITFSGFWKHTGTPA
ncbi:siderophore-interacting protein [Cryptosporangium arvum]|uniref:siderophore-interacting protein n=1 Tax=Cryptosporangium arvum TaxID=80871 RepID=UPI0004B214B7|nr:siderophore-interacting protein [Cryptosporangium arvum]